MILYWFCLIFRLLLGYNMIYKMYCEVWYKNFVYLENLKGREIEGKN